MFCVYNRPKYQVSVYRTIGPLVCQNENRQRERSRISTRLNGVLRMNEIESRKGHM